MNTIDVPVPTKDSPSAQAVIICEVALLLHRFGAHLLFGHHGLSHGPWSPVQIFPTSGSVPLLKNALMTWKVHRLGLV